MKKKLSLMFVLGAALTLSACQNNQTNTVINKSNNPMNVIHGDFSNVDRIPLYSLINSKKGGASYGNYPYEETIKGVKVEIPTGGTFVYNRILDTNKMDGSLPLLKIYPYATNQGSLDYTTLQIRLTDAYNDNNYFELRVMHTGYNDYYTYQRIALPNQAQVGYVWSKNNEGQVVKSIVKGKAGTEVRFSMCGSMQYGAGSPDSVAYKNSYNAFYFNYLTKEFETRTSVLHTRFGGYNQVVADLDDPDSFTTPWQGFSTNECILTISASSYTGGDTAKILINSILDEEIRDEDFVDEVEPKIDVKLNDYQETLLPEGVKDKAYKIFDYAAKDAQSGVKESSVSVYKDYQTASQTQVSINNQSFIPTEAGNYSIVYTAKDYFDNVSNKVLNVKVNEKENPIYFSFDADAIIKKAYVGQKIKVADAIVTGGSGKVNIHSSVICNETGKIYEIEDGYFTPLEEGTYSVQYSGVDYLNNKAIDGYFISVRKYNGPVIAEEVNLPKYLIEGFAYNLPIQTCTNYVTGTSQDVSIKVNDGSGEVTIVDGEYEPHVTNSLDTATITYFTNADMTKTYVIPVVKVEQTKANYFLTEGVDIVANDKNLEFTATSTSFEAEFVNSLVADGFFTVFNIPEAKNYRKVDIYLTDSVNSDESLKISFMRNSAASTKSFMTLNDGINYTTGFDFNGGEFECKYSQSTFVVSDTYDRNVKATTYLNGKAFNGFSSGKVYFKLAIEDCAVGDKIYFSSLSGTSLDNKDIKKTFASIAVNGNYGGHYHKNDVVLIPNAVAGLTFDPCVTLKLSVTDNANDLAINATDGTKMNKVLANKDYSFVASEYTSYLAAYIATDSKGNKSFFEYQIKVINFEKPTITIRGNVPTSAKVGSSYTIPHADLSCEGTIAYYYRTPNGDLFSTNEGNTVQFSEKGNYVIRFFGFDNIGNSTMLDYRVVVY